MTERCRVTEELNVHQNSLAELEDRQPEIEMEIKQRSDDLYAEMLGSPADFLEHMKDALEANPDFVEAMRNQCTFVSPCHAQIHERFVDVIKDYLKADARRIIENEYS